MTLLYGQTISWTDSNGGVSSITVDNCLTRDQALSAAIKSARKMGWSPPKWWQWWRVNDTRIRELDQ